MLTSVSLSTVAGCVWLGGGHPQAQGVSMARAGGGVQSQAWGMYPNMDSGIQPSSTRPVLCTVLILLQCVVVPKTKNDLFQHD